MEYKKLNVDFVSSMFSWVVVSYLSIAQETTERGEQEDKAAPIKSKVAKTNFEQFILFFVPCYIVACIKLDCHYFKGLKNFVKD